MGRVPATQPPRAPSPAVNLWRQTDEASLLGWLRATEDCADWSDHGYGALGESGELHSLAADPLVRQFSAGKPRIRPGGPAHRRSRRSPCR